MRIVASHALSLGNRVVLYVSRSTYALVTGQAQLFFRCHELEFVIGARERQVTYGALPYLKRTVQIFVFDDFGMALAGDTALRWIGMLLFLSGGNACRAQIPK